MSLNMERGPLFIGTSEEHNEPFFFLKHSLDFRIHGPFLTYERIQYLSRSFLMEVAQMMDIVFLTETAQVCRNQRHIPSRVAEPWGTWVNRSSLSDSWNILFSEFQERFQ